MSDTGKTILTKYSLLTADYLSTIGEFVALNGDPFLKGHKSLDISKNDQKFHIIERAHLDSWVELLRAK